jgi:hypothetical protein
MIAIAVRTQARKVRSLAAWSRWFWIGIGIASRTFA